MPNYKLKPLGSRLYTDGSPPVRSENSLGKYDHNVIVSLHPENTPVRLAPTPNARITQRKQTFLPMVVPVTKGSKVAFLNEDSDWLHTIQSENTNMKAVIKKPAGEHHSRQFNKTGLVKLECDTHLHMEGYIWVLDTPYFTRVDDKGNYELTDLPDGRYLVKVFHPKISVKKMQTKNIELKGGQALELNFDLARP